MLVSSTFVILLNEIKSEAVTFRAGGGCIVLPEVEGMNL